MEYVRRGVICKRLKTVISESINNNLTFPTK